MRRFAEHARVVVVGGEFWGCSTLRSMDPRRFGRRDAGRATLRAACEAVYRSYDSLRGGQV